MLRYGIVGGGFVAGFHLRALRQVRGVEVTGLVSRRRPEALAAYVTEHELGDVRIFDSVTAMAPHVDVIAIFSPNFCRLETMEEIAAAARAGAVLRGVICEKPLARTVAEARRMVDLADGAGLPTAYFENQLHMGSVRALREQLRPATEAMGAPVLVRAAEEHSGPHNAWFWDPVRQGGGTLSDMGCHSIALAWYALTPFGMAPAYLEPTTVTADVALLKWGRPRWREHLLERFGVDYGKTPAEDFATGVVTFRDPASGRSVKGQFTNSWMYDKQGLRLLLDGIGPGYAFELNTLRSSLDVFVGDAAAETIADAELALEKSTAGRGLMPVHHNEPDLYGYTDENADAVDAFTRGRAPLLDWSYGVEIVRLVTAAYMSAERGRVVDLSEPEIETYVSPIQQGRGAALLEI